jgi:hypothetical protein
MARKFRRSDLRRSIDEQTIVRVKRKQKFADRLNGFIVDVGAEWVLMAQTSDGGFFDGFVAFRAKDVTSLTRDKSFETTFAKTRLEWPPSFPVPLDLDSTAGLIRGLAEGGRLIGIQKEKKRRATWIGRLDEVASTLVYLHEVRPDASWHSEPLGYKLKAITSVEVGTNYLVALAAVAGKDPTARPA